MPKFAANISMLFTEVPFLQRFAAARQAGFTAIECQFPYEAPIAAIADALETNGLQLVLHNLPPGDWAAGERGLAILPDRRAEFRESLDKALDYARALDCPQVNCLAGLRPGDFDEPRLRQTLIDNLKIAADQLDQAGIRLLIEPINPFDMPGFYLDSVEMADEIIDAVGSDNLYIQYDLYHRKRSGGELITTFLERQDRIAHIQIADVPGRHEPGTGTIDFGAVFSALDRAGYAGWIGCEYHPSTTTEAGLGWMFESGPGSAAATENRLA